MNEAKMIIGSSETNSDILYATQLMIPDSFLYFSTSTINAVVLSELEYDRGLKEVKEGVKVFSYDNFFIKGEKRSFIDLIKKIILEYKIDSIIVPQNFPYNIAYELERGGINIKPSKDSVFFPERVVKSEYEVECIAHAESITELGMTRAYEVLKASTVKSNGALLWEGEELTSDRVRSEINITLIKHGALPSHTIVASGVDSSQPHNVGEGVIYASTPIVIDIFPRVMATNYWGDMTRTFVKGEVPKQIRDAYNAVKKARDEAKRAVKPGVKVSELHQLSIDILTQEGFNTGVNDDGSNYGFIHSLGHGVGLDIHEAPAVSNRIEGVELAVGNVITIEPGLYYPEWGGIRLEDLGVVTKDGFECFNKFPTVIEV